MTTANRSLATPPRAACDPATTADDDERQLLARLRAGEAAAFETLVREHGGRMLAVARRFLRSEDDCHDTVQDALLSAFRGLSGFAGDAALGTWLHRITVNACLMKLRSRKRKPAVSLDPLLPQFDSTGHHARPVAAWGESPHDPVCRDELRAHVRACIDRLPAPYREILLLRDLEEYDTAETAALLGLTADAVKTRLHRARQALRALLEPRFASQEG